MGFNTWLYPKLVSAEVTALEVEHRFPALWNRYLADTNQTDCVAVKWTETKVAEKKEMMA